MTTTIVDVVMPTRGRPDLAARAVRSVLAQTMSAWRLTIVVDGADPATEALLSGVDDERVCVVVVPEPTGRPGVLRQLAIDRTTADIVAYLDDDDTFAPHHLASVTERFAVEPSLDVLAVGAHYHDVDGRLVRTTQPIETCWHPELLEIAALFEPTRVAHRRRTVIDAGGWGDELNDFEDWSLWRRMAARGAQFGTCFEPGVTLQVSVTSRQHQVIPRFGLTIGALAADDTADELRGLELRAQLAAADRDDWREWFTELLDSGELVAPSDRTVEWDDGVPLHMALPAGSDLMVVGQGDTRRLIRPIHALDGQHAGRIREVYLRRRRRWFALLAELVRQRPSG
jgi:hypothetical protein